MTSTDWAEEVKTEPRYWAAYLDSTIEAALDMLADTDEYENPQMPAVAHLTGALEEYRKSGVPSGPVGYVVECQLSEPYALVRTLAEATKMRRRATHYLEGAADSAHPAATGYVNERLPMQVRPVLADEWARIKEDTPILEREP